MLAQLRVEGIYAFQELRGYAKEAGGGGNGTGELPIASCVDGGGNGTGELPIATSVGGGGNGTGELPIASCVGGGGSGTGELPIATCVGGTSGIGELPMAGTIEDTNPGCVVDASAAENATDRSGVGANPIVATGEDHALEASAAAETRRNDTLTTATTVASKQEVTILFIRLPSLIRWLPRVQPRR